MVSPSIRPYRFTPNSSLSFSLNSSLSLSRQFVLIAFPSIRSYRFTLNSSLPLSLRSAALCHGGDQYLRSDWHALQSGDAVEEIGKPKSAAISTHNPLLRSLKKAETLPQKVNDSE
jgi:hypothetical protein